MQGLAHGATKCYESITNLTASKMRAEVLEMTSMTPSHGLFNRFNGEAAHFQKYIDFFSSDETSLRWQEDVLGHQFHEPRWALRALTHTSFVHEAKSSEWMSNERLEFLGDSILGLIITDHLYQTFSDLNEGTLSRLRSSLVNEDVLAVLAKMIQLDCCLLLGKGEQKEKGWEKPSLMADALEAILGAIYKDSDFYNTQNVFMKWIEHYDQIFEKKFFDIQRQTNFDAKTQLQELTMKEFKELPDYRCREEKGLFYVDVCVQGQVLATGSGESKKKLIRKLAQEVLQTKSYRLLFSGDRNAD